ncbi:LIRP-like [Apis laboriosa]|uniref:Insulin-like peptide 2 isoform X1 n=3 Tax=Apis TaxID=7459 RepID=A0A7M7SRN0_APIME|nr:LIRP-like [Apis florea]XP_012343278.1 LIRP-like [Apis florea]XP_012343284.1 LIRP-like [Apis florea]XP_016920721.1 LIRP-like [Apis cerana]XP_016920722.1 LIRP-like [Apis cerana]XP_016920723.1 LIRP-like [Apis cerana]XP_026300673.1 insulin-like peptide 2 isoform X1 [Apis mellifera]XP_026300674.1 insulin-like peptide 2 isoform X1 [Apis mellifera]XP_026300675.1 insulin-like peptide 2 isoform X1 [Apis mellifera]XP_031773194.1 LIRP-like [Apis florea]XP_043801098.1 LIRP-like [Apis laboriosa]XP|eukprot:XP_026300673.1 insulin-like peptide 2 isoform X1 [Apis mellifera]
MFANRLYVFVNLVPVVVILVPVAEVVRSDVFQYGQKGQTVTEMHQYCGRTLSSTLQIMCGSVYNSRFKKSNQEMEMDDYMAFYGYDLYPYKSIKNAKKMIRFRRNSKGIHEECCLKSCTTEELRSYCGAR